MSPDELRKALSEVVARRDFQVPPYPAIALRLQRIFARDNYAIAEVADTISADPVLAARVLGVANSALHRGAETITSLPRAVNRLGARTLSSIAVASGLGASATQAGVLFDVKYRVWRRSVTCALACQKLAPLRELDPNEAFLAGLLHGFGRSVAVAALERVLATERAVTPLVLLEWLAIAEEQRAELALAVGSSWQLPAEILAALQHEPAVAPLAALVAEGERIATQLEGTWRPEPAVPREAQALDELIQSLPPALEALAAVPPAEPRRAHTAIAQPEHALDGERRSLDLPVADCRKKNPATLTCTGITATGLELKSSHPFQEGALVRLAIGAAEQRVELWFNVLLCAPAGRECRVEVELFSPAAETTARWEKLFTASR